MAESGTDDGDGVDGVGGPTEHASGDDERGRHMDDGEVALAERRADDEAAADAAHEPLGPSGFVEDRELTGGPALPLPERYADPTHPDTGTEGVLLEGPEAGPELAEAYFLAESIASVTTLGEATSHHRRGDEHESRVVLEATLGSRWLLPLTPSLHVARAWIRDAALALGTDDPRAAWSALRAVLPTLRDQLPAAEVADAASELPILLRGIWYEGWSGRAEPAGTRAEFVAAVEARLGASAELDPETAIRGVVRLLRERISAGELSHMEGALPRALKGVLAPA